MITETVQGGKIGCGKSYVENLFVIKAEDGDNEETYQQARVVLTREELERFITKLQALLE